jgi:hypothetical protein
MGVIRSADHMNDLNFLIGEWRGEGLVGDDRVTASVRAASRADGALVLDHVTRREGAEDHRERIVLRERRGRLRAFIRPAGGEEQEFQAAEAVAGFRFTRSDRKLGFLAWEIAPEGPDTFRERFLVGEGPAAETVVSLVHRRESYESS